VPIDLPNNGYTVLLPAQNLQVIAIQNCLCSMAVLCTWMKLLIDLQILGYELHKNAFGGQAPPYSAPQTPSRYKMEGIDGSGRKGLGMERR